MNIEQLSKDISTLKDQISLLNKQLSIYSKLPISVSKMSDIDIQSYNSQGTCKFFVNSEGHFKILFCGLNRKSVFDFDKK